ncbi:two pore domain potassium channel family protein [Halobacillus sp. Marseille-Q1614]|uniref:two pore domain potassium channel family protein n=1 Tax=Halobacillus sp. Marseille-Q1614 TaxID=2709134 RepID=UPI00157074E7|nr:two pore domain potassium channel family protein [Halobacillus sp. Marseille-Q1614]
MLSLTVTFLSLVLIIGSIRQLFTSLEIDHHMFSYQIFMTLVLLYTIVTIGFGLIYATLSMQGVEVFARSLYHYSYSWVNEVEKGIYFSGVTLFTVGYGDMMPIGVGRWIALCEAVIGYTIPAALVAKVWQSSK